MEQTANRWNMFKNMNNSTWRILQNIWGKFNMGIFDVQMGNFIFSKDHILEQFLRSSTMEYCSC